MSSHPQPRPAVLTIRVLPGHNGLALIGDADITARDELHAAIATLAADGAGEIHLDLAGLCFIDVACSRELFTITDRCRAARLIVHQPPAFLVRIAELMYSPARVEFSQAPCPSAPPAGHQPSAGGAHGRPAASHGGRPGFAASSLRIWRAAKPGLVSAASVSRPARLRPGR